MRSSHRRVVHARTAQELKGQLAGVLVAHQEERAAREIAEHVNLQGHGGTRGRGDTGGRVRERRHHHPGHAEQYLLAYQSRERRGGVPGADIHHLPKGVEMPGRKVQGVVHHELTILEVATHPREPPGKVTWGS
jgi:hypothetical protein